VTAPAYSNQAGSGISFDGAGSVYVSVGRKQAAIFLADPNPVNSLAFRASKTGSPLAIFATGTDPNTSILAAPAGAGSLVVQGAAGGDSGVRLLVVGTANGLRVGTTPATVRLDATDPTGIASFQPLIVGGSTLQFQAAGLPVQLTISGTLISAVVPIKTLTSTVAGLPAAGQVGARAFVTDASTTLPLGLGLTVVGGGANKVPVYDDGAAWKIG
jgi:hypothetical protein